MKLATLCYVRKDGKTLMNLRNKKEKDMHKDKWNGLGGKIEEGESPEECVIRELKEETNLDIKNPSLKGIITFPNDVGGGETWHVFVYVATEFRGEMFNENDEGIIQWIENDKLLDLKTQPADKLFLKWLDQDKIFAAKFLVDYEKVIEHSVSFY